MMSAGTSPWGDDSDEMNYRIPESPSSTRMGKLRRISGDPARRAEHVANLIKNQPFTALSIRSYKLVLHFRQIENGAFQKH